MRLRASRTVVAAIPILALVILASTAMWAKPRAKRVRVVNTPLPVTGEVDVNVVNTLPVTLEQGTPYQGTTAVSRTGSDDPVVSPLSPEPEPGRILVIEFISGRCSAGGLSKSFYPTLKTTFQGTEFQHRLNRDLVTTITTDDLRTLRYVVTEKTTIFADTDEPIEAGYSQIFGGADWPDVGCGLTVSGYLKNP